LGCNLFCLGFVGYYSTSNNHHLMISRAGRLKQIKRPMGVATELTLWKTASPP
jgi:hypothetical protein